MKFRKEINHTFSCPIQSNSDCFNVTSGAPLNGTSFFSDRQNWRRVVRGRKIDLHSGLFSLLVQHGATDSQNLNTIFSSLFQNSSAIPIALGLLAGLPATRPFTQVQIFSNGVCVSTCSIMSTLLQFVPPPSNIELKFVLYGGVPGLPMDSSIDATNVLEVPGIYPLPFREMLLPSNTNLTRQFSRVVPDFVLPAWADPTNDNTLSLLALAFQLFH